MKKSTKVWWLRRLIKVVYLVLAILLMAELVLYGQSLRSAAYPVWGRTVSAVAILIGGWIVILLSHKLMQRGLVKIGAFLLLFIYGVYVYNSGGAALDDWWSSILMPMNNTLSIFFPSRGVYDEGIKGGFSDITLLYTSVHLLSYLYIAMLGISLLGRRAMNRSTNMFLFAAHRNIFWGYSDGGVLLAKDIMRKSYFGRAVFIMPENMPLSTEMERYRFEEIDGIGGVVLYRDFSKRIRRPRGRRHLFLTEDQDLNVKLAFMVLEELKRQNRSPLTRLNRLMPGYKPTKLYVRTELAHVDRYFSKVLESLGGVAEVHTINESELTARRFIEKYPPLDMPEVASSIDTERAEVNGDFKILQLGYGWTGKAVLNKLICNTQFEGRGTFSATIFDRDLETQHGFYPLLDGECFGTTPGAANYYDITTECTIAIGSLDFKAWVEYNIIKQPEAFNRIIVALGDDALNVKIALSIANLLNGIGWSYERCSKLIFAHIRNADCCTYLDLDVTPISVFGNKNEIYTMDIIVNEKLDEIAMEMNYYYTFAKSEDYEAARLNRRYKRAKLEQWHKASVLDQESSRAAALAIDTSLRLCGYAKTTRKEAAIVDRATVKTKLTNDKLFVNEHNRWNAFHFIQGIKCWDLRGVTYDDFDGDKPKPNRIGQFNRHAALVLFDDLPAIDAQFNPWISQYNKSRCVWPPLTGITPFKLPKVKKFYNRQNKCTLTHKLMAKSNLQASDKKFVQDIATIAQRVGYKIVKAD